MSGELSQTVVVGVGGAGIDVLAALAAGDGSGWRAAYDDRFEYVAIAADPATLQRAPESAVRMRLVVDPEMLADARLTHPYLLPAHGIETDVVGRQRPVGRYAIDSLDGDARTVSSDNMEQVFDTLLAEVDGERSRSYNVVHVHAMDDGIGSGTFPLVAHVVDEATDNLRERHGASIYTAGIGIVPELSHGVGSGFEYVVPPDERWRYANTYAALRDLEMITRADLDDPLPVHFHAERKYDGDSGFVLGDSEPQGRIDRPPYRHYFLVDDGGSRADDAAWGKPYDRRVEEVVAAVYGLATLGSRVHSWLPPPTGTAHFGSFGQAQLSLPITDVRTYCHLNERIEELEGRIDAAAGGSEDEEQTDEPAMTFRAIQAELAAARTEREAVIERLTTPRYGPRRGRLALDERMVRRNLNQETLQRELTSLSAFHDAGYLLRDLRTVMGSRVPLASAWQSRLLTWSEESESGTAGGYYGGRREVWMLHSEENTSLPTVDRIGAGQHTFRRSGGGEFPPFADPYTVQFLTFCVEAPLSDLRIYAELDNAAGERLDALLEEWDDHRLAFAYPEWYSRDIRQYFGIPTRVELPRLPELDLRSVRVDRTGDDLVAWLSSYGLASYLWLADEWDRYQGYITTRGTEPVGWRAELAACGLTYHDMRAVVPNGEPIAQWFARGLSWDGLLSKVVTELAEREGLSVTLTDEESA